MRPNTVKALWQKGQPAVVGWLSTADPYVVETMAQAGFDALVLDMQHGMGIGPDRAAVVLKSVEWQAFTRLCYHTSGVPDTTCRGQCRCVAPTGLGSRRGPG